jgi:hypothetical protein
MWHSLSINWQLSRNTSTGDDKPAAQQKNQYERRSSEALHMSLFSRLALARAPIFPMGQAQLQNTPHPALLDMSHATRIR